MEPSNLKVLFLTDIPSPYRVSFFNELGKLCNLTVLFERKASKNREKSWHSEEFSNFTPIFLKGIKLNANKRINLDVRKYLKEDLFDLFIIGGYSTPTGILAIEVLNFKKIPFILNADGGVVRKESKLKTMIKRHFISSAKYWLSTGNNTSKYLEHYEAIKKNIYKYPFTSFSRQDVLNTIVSENDKNKIKRELNITEEKVILTVGQFIPRKGIDVLLKACIDLPKNYGIYIIGGDPPRQYTDFKERNKLNNVHFINFLDKDELKKYYYCSDVFVLPTREDVWGLVINEAMANGLPVITTEKCVAGLEMIKEKENGFIIPVDDNDTLSDKIKQIMVNESLRKNMAVNSLKKAKEYTIENMAATHLNILETVLKKEN
ncbi:glycosyltransferase family 4 protein [Alteribacillus sp. JSM 102045]|uniref:glycosyltransferase family 4 protein n=1 Tax=Alteribacillus sp. JSM 102045 TaxID=1562101 RepID=UPI0035C1A45A